jgi:glycerophosphoryl diester phosphodiesterase
MTRALPLALALGALLALPATAATDNPWLTEQTFINMAHQGGEDEFPSNTIYAFKQALVAGADTFELDVNRTKDDQFVVMHDWKVDRTTNGTGYTTDMTLAEIQALDAAHNFIPGRNAVAGEPEADYPFRGIRTGAKPPPNGFTPDDFRVPTLAEVLSEFPRTPINIEIKGQEDEESEFLRNAELLAAQLGGVERPERLIVVSFNQPAVDRFHELAPEIDIAPGLVGLFDHFVNGKPMPNADAVAAIQIPTEYAGIKALTPERVVKAHESGWAVHVWLSGDQENARVYNDLLDHCVDGIMPAKPKALERVLRKRDVVRPGGKGTDPCSVGATGATLGSGRVNAPLRRRGIEPLAYTGTVELRSRADKRLAAGRFKLGKTAKKGRASLALTKAGRAAVAAGRPIRGSLFVRTKGKRGEAVRTKVTLRP